jgi:hypothetical protein
MMRSLIFVLLLLLAIAVPTFACEPTRGTSEFTLEDYVNNAEFIFVGTVIDGENEYGDSNILVAEIVVSTYLKGQGPEVVQVAGFGYGPDCLSTVDVGDERIFFVQRAADGSLMAAYLSAHDAVRGVSPERIADVQAITGQSNPPQSLSVDAQIRRFLARYWLATGGTVLIVLALSGAIWSSRRRPSRKAKMKREEL